MDAEGAGGVGGGGDDAALGGASADDDWLAIERGIEELFHGDDDEIVQAAHEHVRHTVMPVQISGRHVEIEANHRSESVRVRAIEAIEPVAPDELVRLA